MVQELMPLLTGDADAAAWAAVLDEDVRFETLGKALSGRGDVAAQLAGTRFAHLDWARLEHPALVLAGSPRPNTRDRGLVLTIEPGDGGLRQVSVQNMPIPPHVATPMWMDPALRDRFDTALVKKHAMSIAYVDADGRPQLSLRGSLRTFDEETLCFWARDATGGIAAAIAINPHVALLYRDEEARATYRLAGRAWIAEDETTRRHVYADIPPIEQQHDFARLGAAILIELDLVEGYAGLGPAGQIDPVRLERGA